MHNRIFFFFFLFLSLALYGQDTAVSAMPLQYLGGVESKLQRLEGKLDQKMAKALTSLQNQDQRIYKKLLRRDSVRAAAFLTTSKVRIASLQQKLKGGLIKASYMPYLDTLKTSLRFLQGNERLLSNIKGAKEVEEALSRVKGLEEALGKGESLKAFLKERKGFLSEQLQGLPFTKELQRANRQAYYYAAQIKEYKEVLKDKKKLERKALELLTNSKPFKDFMQKNSELASLFNLGGDSNNGGMNPSLQGLQTRAQVTSLIQGRIAAGGAGAADQLRANLQAAQSQLTALKDKVAKYGGSSSEEELPDFKPNGQKTKSFLSRLEVGTNLQTQKARWSFPVTSDLGLSLGYKLNDKSIVGIGASYKLGLGTGWNNLELSHQGVGLRSFLEYKLKGSFFLSGGYEQNYQSTFYSMQQLRDYSAWQKSGLIGVSKKYKVSKKLKGSMQLLWDFLSYEQIPRTQAIVFRIGYSIK